MTTSRIYILKYLLTSASKTHPIFIQTKPPRHFASGAGEPVKTRDKRVNKHLDSITVYPAYTTADETETDVKDTANLRNLAQRCVSQFILIAKQDGVENGIVDSHWAARQSAEFNVWCTNIGVNGEGIRSIDLRLKDVPDICSLLRHLLESLDYDLKELLQPTEALAQSNKNDQNLQDDDSDDTFCYVSSSNSDESDEDLGNGITLSPRTKQRRALQKHISDTIDRLHSHAQQIQSAAVRHWRERVELYREKDGPKEVYEGFKRLASWRANENFKSASTTMKLRIAESVARRRIRFEYLREHQRKRAVNLNSQTANMLGELQVNPLGNTVASPEKQQHTHQATKSKVPVQQGTIYSATVNTRLDMKPEQKQSERVESVASVALRHPGFPPAPKVLYGKFQCPYCFLEFPAREALKDRWSQHVMHNFEPYFCILDECEAPFDVPTTFDGLMGHLQDHHPKRYHVMISDLEEREFDEAEFESFVKMNGEASEADLAFLKKASQRRGVFLFQSCPFCGGYPDVLEKRFPDPIAEKAQTELRKHIKQHMQDIALFLPPYRDDISDDEDLESCVMGSRRLRSDRTLLEDSDDWKSICDRSSCDCKQGGGGSGFEDFFDADIQQTTPENEDFWPQILADASRYDRSAVTDD
ncbi:uncharacterized protein N7483_007649 [Penicillium malachiteum]|uniref:uncharacterized protein n=1 Tax=Penicillium malachiteum TaxID=1324776 RepID=UPI0025477F4F|nr:uncharacterized protein N7483_007649 [Penicillium malachiteum]KAJ5726292.1 hypothetical protein N7483_007649 [Penicillium malachiteum]